MLACRGITVPLESDTFAAAVLSAASLAGALAHSCQLGNGGGSRRTQGMVDGALNVCDAVLSTGAVAIYVFCQVILIDHQAVDLESI